MSAPLFKSLCLVLLSEYCYEEFFVNFNFFHVECLKALISKGLGLGIVAGSIFVKVPQLIKIFNAKSGKGLNMTGISLEIFAILSNVAYNFVNRYPFSAYGDGFFLVVQTALVAAMVLYYEGEKQKSILYLIIVGSLSVLLCSGLIPMILLWSFQASTIPIILFAKMIQAWTNYQNKSTGQLSAITLSLLFFGSAARIFTSLQETGDSVIIATYCASTFANGVIMFQLILYRDSGRSLSVPRKKKQ